MDEIRQELEQEQPSAELGTMESMELDLGSFSSVRRFVSAYEATGNPCHVLINNAGASSNDRCISRGTRQR